jgi:hypothetical protein
MCWKHPLLWFAVCFTLPSGFIPIQLLMALKRFKPFVGAEALDIMTVSFACLVRIAIVREI